MNTNRRTEPFRYTLKEPFTFDLHILTINEIPVTSKPVRAVLFDISRSGCHLSLPININLENNLVRVGMEINLTVEPTYIEGTMKWNKEQDGSFHYGIQLDIPESDRDRLPGVLRKLAGEGKILVR
ncbi:PilZ domain-containing protein [Paenibacillus agri]|uniref:PilZ domain-containing protein n=1 Tax=Paenibacillus agri TaxID=2744309 RepID=A0A850EV11_9BACL|nr:PilZ domain-containing protein [Paenibacillus agri]NUU64446.1 PilZ domain-containing protein [Paenibacillus agri]